MGKSLAELNVIIGARAERFNKAMSKVQREMRQVQKLGRNLSSVGDSIARNIGAPLLAASVISGKAAVDIAKNFTKIENLVGVSADKVARFKDQVADVSRVTAKSQQELSAALFTVTSAGLRGQAAIDVLTSSAKASAVGLGDTTEIARATTAVLQAYGQENISAAEATEVLFKTVRAGNLEASELAPSLGRVIGVAAEMGVSFAEVGANVATFTRLGVSSEEAITGLRSVLTSFLNPTAQAREALAGLGISADDLRQSIADNGLAATLVSLQGKLKGNYDTLGQVIPNVRALSNFLGVAGSQGEEYQRIVAELTADTGEMGKAFANTAQTDGFKLQSALNDLKNASVSLGAVVVPIAAEIAKRVSALAQRFENLSPATKKVGVVAAGTATALGVMLSITGRIISGIVSFRKVLILAKGAFAALNVVMRANPIGFVIGAIAALSAGIATAYKRSAKFRGVIKGIGNVAKTMFMILKEALGGFVDSFKSFAEGDWKGGIKSFGKALVDSNPVAIAFTQGERLAQSYTDAYKAEIAASAQDMADATSEAVPKVIELPAVTFAGANGNTRSGSSAGSSSTDGANPSRPSVTAASAISGIGGLQELPDQISSFGGQAIERLQEVSARMREKSAEVTTAIATDLQAMAKAAFDNTITVVQNIGSIIGAMQKIAGKNRIFAIAQIATNTGIAIAKAVASGAGVPFPANLGAITSGIAAALSGIAQAKSALSKAPKLAMGGLAFGPTMAMVGDNPGASVNPEVIAPLDKLRSMMNPTVGAVQVTGVLRASGDELIALIDTTRSSQLRYT